MAKVGRTEESCISLKSAHKFFYRGKESKKIGGVDPLIFKRIANNVVQFKAISERVISADIQINRRVKYKFILVYAPTSDSKEKEIDQFYEVVNKALLNHKTRYVIIIIEDFNTKIGKPENTKERSVGKFGLVTRDSRGKILSNFANEKLACYEYIFPKSRT